MAMLLSNEYVAGLFDGEGCIQAVRNSRNGNRRLHVTIRNSHQAVLQLIQARWGGSISRTKPKGKRAASFGWLITSRGAVQFLKDIEPFLVIKRPEALIAFEFQKTMRSWGGKKGKLEAAEQKLREQFSEKLKTLKRVYKEYEI